MSTLAAADPVQATNEATNAKQVREWHNDPPARAFVYVQPSLLHVTTWMGTVLGTIRWAGKPYRSAFGDERINIRVEGDNGQWYSGTYYKSAGDYARLRMVKP